MMPRKNYRKPESKAANIVFRASRNWKLQLEQEAENLGIKPSELIRLAVNAHLERSYSK